MDSFFPLLIQMHLQQHLQARAEKLFSVCVRGIHWDDLQFFFMVHVALREDSPSPINNTDTIFTDKQKHVIMIYKNN